MITIATTPAAFFEAAFATLANQVRAARARRAQRVALRSILFMDARQLDDLGIVAQDVIEAIEAKQPAGRYLEARRAERAAAWSPAVSAAA